MCIRWCETFMTSWPQKKRSSCHTDVFSLVVTSCDQNVIQEKCIMCADVFTFCYGYRSRAFHLSLHHVAYQNFSRTFVYLKFSTLQHNLRVFIYIFFYKCEINLFTFINYIFSIQLPTSYCWASAPENK